MPLTINRIPASYRPGLAKLKTLSQVAVNALADSLETEQASDFAKLSSVVEVTTQASPEDAANIIAAVRSLYILKARADSEVGDFVTMLVAAMQMTGGSLVLSEAEKPIYAEKLTRLLNIKSLERSTKVEQLRMDHPSILEDIKILTDLRPVFDKTGERPVGAIVTHTLKLVSHESGDHKELYFALDAEDVSMLKRIAERALEKMTSLKGFLNSANLKDLT